MGAFDDIVAGERRPAASGGAFADIVGADARASQAPATPAFEDPGIAGTLLIGAGRATDQLVKGAQQLYYKARDDKPALERLAAEVEANNAAYAPLANARPWSTGIGETLPDLALMLGSGGTSLIGAATRGAIAGAAPGAAKYGTLEERAARGVIGGAGGAAGGAGGAVLNRVLQPAGAAVNASADTLGAAGRIGYRPLPSQLTGSPSLQSFENYLLRTPGSSGIMQAAQNANTQAINRAAARAMGEAGADLGETTFANASRRIGGEFDRLQGVTQINRLDTNIPFLDNLVTIAERNAQKGPYRNTAVDTAVDQALNLAAQGRVTGTAYKEIRTELTSQINATSDAAEKQAIRAIRTQLDNAARNGLSAADREAWDTARSQWKAYKQLAMGNTTEAGNVSPARLASVVRRADGDALRTGRLTGDVADIARLGEGFKAMPNPTSGSLMQQMIFGNPITGIPAGLANRAAVAAYMNPLGQRYFTRGLVDIGDVGRHVVNRGGGLLGAPAAYGLLGSP